MQRYFSHLKIFIVSVTIIAIGFLLPLQTPSAQATVHDPIHAAISIANGILTAHNGILYFVKEFIIKPTVRKIANVLQNKIENKILSITSQLNGKTRQFITNWRGEVLGSLGQGNDVFRTVLANTQFCSFFDKNLKQVFGADKYTGSKDTCVASCLKQEETASQCGQLRPQKCKDNPLSTDRECVDFQNITPAYDLCMAGSADKCNRSCTTSITEKVLVPGASGFQIDSQCGLNSNFDPLVYLKDPSKAGGLDTFNALLTNNYYTALSRTLAEHNIQLGINYSADQLKLLTGQGFKPLYDSDKSQAGGAPVDFNACYAECRTQGVLVCQAAGPGAVDACIVAAEAKCTQDCVNKAIGSSTPSGQNCPANEKFFGRCIFNSDIKTPPRVFDAATAAAIDKKLGRPGTATELTDIILSLFDAVTSSLVNTLFDFGSNTGQIPDKDYSPGAGDPIFDPNSTNQPAPGLVSPTPTPNPTFGTQCDIQEPNNCGTQLFCTNAGVIGICVECDDAHSCSGGQICDRGAAIPTPVPGSSPRPSPLPTPSGPGICVSPGGNDQGGFCYTSAQCISGLICGAQNKCKPPNPNKSPSPTPDLGQNQE